MCLFILRSKALRIEGTVMLTLPNLMYIAGHKIPWINYCCVSNRYFWTKAHLIGKKPNLHLTFSRDSKHATTHGKSFHCLINLPLKSIHLIFSLNISSFHFQPLGLVMSSMSPLLLFGFCSPCRFLWTEIESLLKSLLRHISLLTCLVSCLWTFSDFSNLLWNGDNRSGHIIH